MSSESAFNKKLQEETTMDQVEGLLDHFNLPPKLITFIRANQRKIQIIIGVVVVVVVAWSLYDSHREKTIEQAATSLSLAMQEQGDTRVAALNKVVEEFGSTSSAMWAKIELAHTEMKKGSFSKAATGYDEVLGEVESVNPLYPLVLFAKAQALEAGEDYEGAKTAYDTLKGIKGYEHIAYLGRGRLEEAKGDMETAIAVYNNFLLQAGDDPSFAQARVEIEAKIARVKAIK